MAIIKWNRNPVDVMPGFSNLIDNFFGRDISDYLGDFNGTMPTVNIRETQNEFMLEVAAPGMKKEDFDLNLENNVLTVSGNKEVEEEKKDEKYHKKEHSYTSFQRSFYLPDDVKSDSIEAHYQDGILMVTVPKRELKEKESKKISIS